ncbi:MAG: DUF896 domain-containing protein [Oscillospiraceae bacterium]|nr:DUF896 domain-containing protein [Oscillospiraceae bacterium]
MIDERIARINELYRKSKTAQGLTEAEKAEQKRLREEYVKGFRRSLISQLNNVTIQEPDGTEIHLKDKGIKE